jgi:hypothetical protein
MKGYSKAIEVPKMWGRDIAALNIKKKIFSF